MRILQHSATILLVLFLGMANHARAAEDNWVKFVSAAHDGYVFSFSHPPGWKITDRLPHSIDVTAGGLATSISGITAKAKLTINWRLLDWNKMLSVVHGPFASRVNIKDVPPDIMNALMAGRATSAQLDRIIPKEGCGWLRATGLYSCVAFERSPFRLANIPGLLFEYSRSKVYNVDEKIISEPINPSEFSIFFAPVDGKIGLRLLFLINLELNHLWPADGNVTDPNLRKLFEYSYRNSALAPIYAELSPVFLQALRSATLRHVSKLNKDIVVREVYKSQSIRISERRDYHAISSFSLRIPSNWQRRKPEFSAADESNERGRLQVQFAAPTGTSALGDPERILVVLDGMPVGPLSPDDFLATTDLLAEKLTSEFTKLKTDVAELDGFGFAKLRSTYITGTGKVYLSTYTGKDRAGNELKFRIYTAGGQTMVAHFVYLGDAVDYDALLPTVETMVKSLEVNFFSPGMIRQ